MCSFLVQIVYGACMILTVILTIVALAVDGWASVTKGAQDAGLFCDVKDLGKIAENSKISTSGVSITNPCPIDFSKFGNMDTLGKVIIACLILAIIMEIVCIAYNLFTAFACCCKDILLYVLLAFTLFVVLMLGIVMGAAAKRDPTAFGRLEGDMNKAVHADSAADAAKMGLGKSFIMIVVAFVASIVDVVVCGVAIFCAKKAV